MKVEFIKDHPSGLIKGQVKTLSIIDANALIKMGIAKKFVEAKKTTKKK